jgi:HK97 family phage portal protein
MRILGFEITRAKALPAQTLSQVSGRGWHTIFESFPGAWQRNVEVNMTEVTSHTAVFACMTLIAGDVSKLGSPDFKRLNGKIWNVASSSSYDPVLREPNQFQTPNQFWENWVLSKLWKGNTYALKGRDERGVVRRLWILDPCKVTPLISESGDVWYQLMQDNVSGVKEASRVVPQSEIIHDRMNPIFHPLVGISPLYAAGLAAQMGLHITQEGAIFFKNRRIPGGILTSPHTITDETAARLQREWVRGDTENIGKTRVLGDGLEFKTTTATASDSQMLELAKATAEWVCSVFHVPPYMIGIGAPVSSAIESLNLYYYSQAIQKQLEDIEACLVRGLEMKSGTKVEFDTDGLLRMDTMSLVQSIRDAVGAGVMSPDEGRAKLGLAPVAGGSSPYLQQQNYSLEALAKRDAQDDPFKPNTPAPLAPIEPEPSEDSEDDDSGDEQRNFIPDIKDILRKARAHERRAA